MQKNFKIRSVHEWYRRRLEAGFKVMAAIISGSGEGAEAGRQRLQHRVDPTGRPLESEASEARPASSIRVARANQP